MSVTATARVATERGERYRKQLASHFGNKIEVAEDPSGTVLRWGFGGSTTLTVNPGTGTATSSTTITSGPPKLWIRAAFMLSSPAQYLGMWVMLL